GKLNGLYWNSIPNVDVQKSVLFISPFAKLRLFRNYICCYYFFFSVSLADIDECSASKPVCATNATGCQNTVGSFSCSCEAGFGGRYCNDIDECKSQVKPCDVNADCQNTRGSYVCSCKAGFNRNGNTCTDINECSALGPVCDVHAKCENIIGSYLCSCKSGFFGNGKTCSDYDECSASVVACDPLASCQNTAGSFLCLCQSGYTGDGRTCIDVDECHSGSFSCHAQGQCINVMGSYDCRCLPGYTGDGQHACSDVDECQDGSFSCHAQGQCVNSQGSYDCTCLPGYTGDGDTKCLDVDECQKGSYHCHEIANCVNVIGSYDCMCKPGYEGDGKNMCSVHGQSFVRAISLCPNLLTVESYASGIIFSNMQQKYSNDMNCNWTISSNAKLELAFIRFQTESGCDFVKVFDGLTSSTLIGEYDGDSLPASITTSSHELSVTFTTDGSVVKSRFLANYHISGQPFATVSSSCADMLTVRSSSSGMLFSNRDGAYANDVNCSWSISSSNNVELIFFKFDTEENYDYIYVYDGASMMSSLIGKYHGNSLPAVITSSSKQLYVTFSSDKTVSSSGFAASYHAYNTIRLVGGNTTLIGRVEVYHSGQWGTICEDGWDINDAHVICRQLGFPSATQAFYSATHGQGSGQIWIDNLDCSGYELRIDECNHDGWGNHDCGHNEDAIPLGSVPEVSAETCREIKASEGGHATSGKYWFDSLIPGEVVQAHCNMETEDLDECKGSFRPCDINANCQNTWGSYVCSCKPGFTGSGKACSDVNECSTGSAVCDPNADCQNTFGCYLCSCKSGFYGNGKTCSDADECSFSVSPCDANAICGNTVGSFNCSCKTGYTGDGLTCTDIDECTQGSHGCLPDLASCINTDGSYSCTCNAGYTGDGKISCEIALPEECENYQSLTTSDRKTSNTRGCYTCDSSLSGWYRFKDAAGTRMPTTCPPTNRCDACSTGWLNGVHPTTADGKVTRQVCFNWISGQPFATVSSSCADKLTVRSSSSGIIFSNRDGAYAHDVNCSWSIFSSTNVELVFFRFDTEENHDYIYVYDGGSMMSSLIGKYHGNSLPAVITSSSNQLYVTFSSDNKVSSTGFAASYHAYNTIRLVGGNTTLTGRVEVYHGGQWGTICEDGWDINDAHVICRQLGFPSATQAFHGAKHGQGSGQIWIDSLDCSGYELRIDECNHDGWGNHDCGHNEDASVE
ncbi:hypothetical protein pdam_00006913, partial [Pocillopora damicornis]